MLHSCGQTHYQLLLNNVGVDNDNENIENYVAPTITTVSKQLYTAYLGQVTVDVPISGDTVFLEKYHSVNNQPILVKVVDANEHNLSQNIRYTLNRLKRLSAAKINLTENKYHYVLTLLCWKKFAQINQDSTLITKYTQAIQPFLSDEALVQKITTQYPELITDNPTKSVGDYKKVYQKVVEYNSPVDVFFNTINYLDFLYQTTSMVSVNKLDSLLSISGVANLDNAFFTGEYMVYGNGEKMFNPLTSIDVIGHELSHGLVQGTAALEYKGHSGALNESFADIMGTMFEFYMYDKFPSLSGTKDWLIGEDLGIGRPFLRSMEDPNAGNQPDKYKGTYYADPNGQFDYGGVHINSGITNYCFYIASQQKDKFLVLGDFIKCLNSLQQSSNFMDFRNQLKLVSNNDPIISLALNKVGLNDAAITDYGRQPPPPLPPTPEPTPEPTPDSECKHCPEHCPPENHTPQPRIPQPRIPQPRIPRRFPQPRFPRRRFPQPRIPRRNRFQEFSSNYGIEAEYYDIENMLDYDYESEYYCPHCSM